MAKTLETVEILEPGAGIVHENLALRAGDRIDLPEEQAYKWVRDGKARVATPVRVRVLRVGVIINNCVLSAGDETEAMEYAIRHMITAGDVEIIEPGTRQGSQRRC